MAFLLNNKKVLAYAIHYTSKLVKKHLQKIQKFHDLRGKIVFSYKLEAAFEKIIGGCIFGNNLPNISLKYYKYKEVYIYLLSLKRGQVITYTDLAKRTGYMTREVIQSLKHNPFLIIIPCHRVIRKDGDISGYTPLGKEFKRKLLQVEGYKDGR